MKKKKKHLIALIVKIIICGAEEYISLKILYILKIIHINYPMANIKENWFSYFVKLQLEKL